MQGCLEGEVLWRMPFCSTSHFQRSKTALPVKAPLAHSWRHSQPPAVALRIGAGLFQRQLHGRMSFSKQHGLTISRNRKVVITAPGLTAQFQCSCTIV